ncbi:hypothetical protein PO909_002816 [Leuciscus waleckii]
MSAVLKWHPQGMNDIHRSSRAITVRQEVACCKWVPASFMCSRATGEGTDGVLPSQAWPHGSDLNGRRCFFLSWLRAPSAIFIYGLMVPSEGSGQVVFPLRGCLLRLTGARGRDTVLIVSVLQTGGPLGRMDLSLSQRSSPSFPGTPLTPTARGDPADLFHS